jgi:hypothetical protein
VKKHSQRVLIGGAAARRLPGIPSAEALLRSEIAIPCSEPAAEPIPPVALPGVTGALNPATSTADYVVRCEYVGGRMPAIFTVPWYLASGEC